MHKTPNLAQLSTPRCAQARPGVHRRAQAHTVVVSWPLARPCRSQGRPCCSLHGRVATRHAPVLATERRAPRAYAYPASACRAPRLLLPSVRLPRRAPTCRSPCAPSALRQCHLRLLRTRAARPVPPARPAPPT